MPQRAPVALGVSVAQRVWVPQGVRVPHRLLSLQLPQPGALAASAGSTDIKKKGS